MAWSYERNINHTYIVYNGIQSENTYEIQMILKNPIKGLLTSHLDKIDGKARLLYEISSKQPLSSIYEKKKMNYISLKALLQSMQMVLNRIEEYLLSPAYLITDPDIIYVNPGKDEFFFCLVPDVQNEENSLHKLMEYILECIDYTDERAVAAAYEWYKRTGEENYSFTKIFYDVFENSPGSTTYRDGGQQSKTDDMPLLSQSNKEVNRLDVTEQISSKSIKSSNTIIEPENMAKKEERTTGKVIILKWVWVAVGLMILIAAVSLLGIVFDFYKHIMQPVLAAVVVVGVTGGWFWYRRIEDDSEEDEEFDFVLDQTEKEQQEQRIWIDEDGVYRMGDRVVTQDELSVEQTHADPAEMGETYEETVFFQNVHNDGIRRLESVTHQFPEFIIELFPFILGKLEGAVDGIIKDDTVSRIHCKIEMEAGEYYITDLNSTNGTFVNGTMLCTNKKTNIQTGDEILIGKAVYRFI